MSQTDLVIHDEKDNVAVVVIDKTANGRITCAEALGHKEFVITKAL